MRCNEVMELMQRNLDGDLTNAEYEQFVDHLSGCSECRDLGERFKQLSFNLEALPKVDPPISLVDAILPQISQPIPLSNPRKKQSNYWAIAGSVAAVLAVILVWPSEGSKLADHAGMKVDHSATSSIETPMKNATNEDATTKEAPAKMATEEKTIQDTLSKATINDTTAMVNSPQTSTPVTEKEVPAPAPAKFESQDTATENKPSTAPTVTANNNQEIANHTSKEESESVDKVPINTLKQREAAVAAPPMSKNQALQSSAVGQSTQTRGLVAGVGTNTADQPMSIAAAQPTAQTSASSDGRLIAEVVDQTIQIRNNKMEVVYRSHRFDLAEQVHIDWLDNQQLIYELKHENSVERWKINLASRQEQKE